MVSVNRLPSLLPDAPKEHHVGNPPTGFKNPWPSFNPAHHGLGNLVKVRFGKDRPAFAPVPTTRDELVPVRKADFSNPDAGFKVTWIGHASFLLQTSRPD